MHFRNLLKMCILLGTFLASTPSYGDMHDVGDCIYDDTLKIFWTKNANMNGLMSWSEATDWISDLNASHFGGYDDWRLPSTPDGTWGYNGSNAAKYNVTVSELGHLYYTSLGLEAKSSTTSPSYTADDLATLDSPFENLQPALYWFGTISEMNLLPDQQTVWRFDFGRGTQFIETANGSNAYALAVRSATPVPLPSSASLFLTGLVVLFLKRSRSNP